MGMKQVRVAVIILAGVLVFSSSVLADNIISRPVGLVRVEISAQGQALVSLPFEPFDENINSVLAGQLTGGTNLSTADAILKWDSANSIYIRAVKVSATGLPEINGKWISDFDSLKPSDVTLLPGEGFYILLNKQAVNQSVILAGKVVLAATNEMALLPGMNLISYPFSTSARLEDTALSGKVEGADVLELGKGYWCEVAGGAGMVWAEVSPYATDMFPADNGTPQITGMSVIDGGSAVRLMIRCAGIKGEMLDIFYKDVSVTDRFDTLNGWQIAVSNWDLGGKTEVAWEDHGGDGRTPVNQVEARYYLVSRADIDSDGDGIPDAREGFVYGISSGGEVTNADGMSQNTKGDLNLDGTVNTGNGTAPSAMQLSGNGKTIYVNHAIGDDTYSGALMTVTGTMGPKRTINAGINTAISGDTIIVRPGEYYENVSLPDGIRMICEGRVVMN
jgi:hypothetical protein